MNKNKRIITGILIIVSIIVIGVVTAYALIDNDVASREKNFNSKVENVGSSSVETVDNNEENNQKYSKIVDNTKLELNIPSGWKYEEMPKNVEHDFYRYALKMYKDNERQYAVLYFYNNQFGVCGTGRTTEKMTLNNGKEACVGYYDGDKNWSDISFYDMNKYIAVVNYGLIDDEADEAVEFIKKINIMEGN